MRRLYTLLFLLSSICIRFSHAQASHDACFDSTHFIAVGNTVTLDKSCWQSMGIEYNRCEEEHDLLYQLWHSSDQEAEFWKTKYLSEKNTRTETKALLDSTHKAFQQSSVYLVEELKYNNHLEESLLKARKNNIVYAGAGGTIALIGSLVLRALFNTKN